MGIGFDCYWNAANDLARRYEIDVDELAAFLGTVNEWGTQALEYYIETGDEQSASSYMYQIEERAKWAADDLRLTEGTCSFVLQHSQEILDYVAFWAKNGLF